jgi:Zn-dependent protease
MDSSIIVVVYQVIVLVFSVIIHEISHGFVAEELGDDTARRAGRLTLNPIPHIDPFGSILLPLILSLFPGGIVLGWAKPVPFNPLHFKNMRRGSMFVALAGPVSNLLLAGIFALITRGIVFFGFLDLLFIIPFLKVIIVLNIVLAVFNLVPIPPLDGSKVLFYFLPRRMERIQMLFEQYGFFILILFIVFGVDFIHPIIEALYRFFVGV